MNLTALFFTLTLWACCASGALQLSHLRKRFLAECWDPSITAEECASNPYCKVVSASLQAPKCRYLGYYEDYWWAELPNDAKAAAAAFGYNQNLWDNDAVTAASDQYWSGLTAAQQHAAFVLGWNKDAWDSS